ncbi:NUR1 (YDL089W) [Zygosaccharomyces parabailii]|uniref:Nuclear rim protein 1 n=1 Tax=Zygosaccharomyces bailii (strain CLIB 213 / ATCC 58445 / CBS 680 / BCRC 21525 / NBRC 1098 / NCYC 1416 / NRRL Y-2227) TaxID=1333698 RepID=A0A8J2T4S7_ZYGB2|nr:NUR1 (YDL089W) [Zygosaccharomyces parabailii]CDF88487.1 BN860_11408g1_1 [Zygosaccharomyces bailii CLIB 213]CDH14633.1 related to Nuclear rim protein 1 [Zygosaccharomyces bailii ISA1307]
MSLRLSKNVSVSLNTGDLLPEDDGCDESGRWLNGWIGILHGIITTHPSDWHLALNERLETIDWDSKSTSVAQPLGNVLTFAFYTVRLLQINLIRPNLHRINKRTDNFDLSKSDILKKYDYLSRYTSERGQSVENIYYQFLGRLGKFFDVAIVLLLLANGFITYKYLLGSFKTYSLFYLKHRPRLEDITRSSLKTLGQPEEEQSLWSMLRIFAGFKNKERERFGDEDDDNYFYKLSKWTSSKFITTLFVSFAPTCIVFLLLTDVSFSTAFAVVFHQWILRFIITNRYGNRIEHELVIASATLAEWEAKYVNPKMSKPVQDVAIDSTPYGDGMVKFFPALTSRRSHIFKTHSLSGEIVTETFNPKTQEFEDLQDDIGTHNVVRRFPHDNRLLYDGPYDYQRSVPFNIPSRTFSSSREPSPSRLNLTRESPKEGFCSSLVSSTSGMSTPVMRPDRAAYLNPGYAKPALSGRESYFTNDNPRKNSKNPLRNVHRSSISTAHSADLLSGNSSRSSSRSSTRRNSASDV